MVSRYVSKFMTDFLPSAAATVIPSVFATVIGAWIVTHYINPKDSADQSKAKTEASGPAAKAPLNGASGMSLRPVETVAVKPTSDEPAEAARRPAREKAATPAKDRDASKEAKAAPQQPIVPAPSRTEERKDATDLARAALERLRKDTPELASPAPVVAAPVVLAPGPAPLALPPTVMTTPAPVAMPPAPALPPPVVITAPRDIQPVFEASSRPVPPADIPVNGDGLATGSAVSERTSDNPSLFGDLKSAAKSLVQTVIPR